jgi:hypothetical protein
MNRRVMDSVSQLLECREYNGCKTGNACLKIDRNDAGTAENPVPADLSEAARMGGHFKAKS